MVVPEDQIGLIGKVDRASFGMVHQVLPATLAFIPKEPHRYLAPLQKLIRLFEWICRRIVLLNGPGGLIEGENGGAGTHHGGLHSMQENGLPIVHMSHGLSKRETLGIGALIPSVSRNEPNQARVREGRELQSEQEIGIRHVRYGTVAATR